MWRRILLVLPILLGPIAACTKWAFTEQPLTALPDKGNGIGTLRLHLASGQSVVIHQAGLRNDSVTGFINKSKGHQAFATADLKSVEIQRTDGVKTAFAILGVAVAALAVAGVIAAAGMDGSGGIYTSGTSASCPMVYSWDGSQWLLDSGTFGGAITLGLQRTDLDGLDHLVAVDGVLKLRVTNELDETDHIDALELLVVDHAPGTRIAPDGTGRLHVLRAPLAPVAARDFSGLDALVRVRSADGHGWESRLVSRDTSRIENARDGLELRFPRPATNEAHLVLEGNNTVWATYLLSEWLAWRGPGLDNWYSKMDSDPAMARAVGAGVASEAFLTATVLTTSGWKRQGLYWEAGPEVSKRQVMHLDLRDVAGDEVVVRLEAPPAFWWIDAVSLEGVTDETMQVVALHPDVARTWDRSDPIPLLAAVNREFASLETGQWMELDFAAPPARAGQTRSYALRSNGWYHVNTNPRAVAETELLRRVDGEPGAMSRVATGRLNDAIRTITGAR